MPRPRRPALGPLSAQVRETPCVSRGNDARSRGLLQTLLWFKFPLSRVHQLGLQLRDTGTVWLHSKTCQGSTCTSQSAFPWVARLPAAVPSNKPDTMTLDTGLSFSCTEFSGHERVCARLSTRDPVRRTDTAQSHIMTPATERQPARRTGAGRPPRSTPPRTHPSLLCIPTRSRSRCGGLWEDPP